MKNQKKLSNKQIVILICIGLWLLLLVITPALAVGIAIIAVILAILYLKTKMEDKQRQRESSDRNTTSEAGPNRVIKSFRSKDTEIQLPKRTEQELKEMDAPQFVKSNIRRRAAKCGGTLDSVLADDNTPDILKRYIRSYRASLIDEQVYQVQHQEFASVDNHPYLDFENQNKAMMDSIPEEEEDGLYNSEDYESVQEDTAKYEPNLIYINGQPVHFHNKSNPFEM